MRCFTWLRRIVFMTKPVGYLYDRTTRHKQFWNYVLALDAGDDPRGDFIRDCRAEHARGVYLATDKRAANSAGNLPPPIFRRA